MSNKDIKVPNIGEFKDVEVIEVLIKKGQKIKKNDPLITIESDKSSVEIPSSDDGTTSVDKDGIILGVAVAIGGTPKAGFIPLGSINPLFFISENVNHSFR